MKEIIWLVVGIILLGVMAGYFQTSKKSTKRRTGSRKRTLKKVAPSRHKSSKTCRPDEQLLTSSLEDLNGAEFERLLALYFRDQGYLVQEVGVGGNDGGVDLVITDKRGEKIAVQAKCYSDHNLVPVMTVRELVGAKRNHDCILSLLVTTSDLTAPAKKEAEQFKVDYWHGGLVAQKFSTWGKWQPPKKKSRASVRTKQLPAAHTAVCVCGAPMVQRKGKDGTLFLGCSTFPNCRKTRAI